MATEQTAPSTEKNQAKYNLTLGDDMLADLNYCSGRLDCHKSEIFRRAVAYFRKAVENGDVK